jgi:hypothetical protein
MYFEAYSISKAIKDSFYFSLLQTDKWHPIQVLYIHYHCLDNFDHRIAEVRECQPKLY